MLLALGVEATAGAARAHHQAQIAWLSQELTERGLPVWTVGGTPSHPSLWQRFTHRTHPGLDFDIALAKSFIRMDRRA